jgi:hypothetical protein
MDFEMDLATPKPSVQVGSAQNGWPLGVSINSAPHPAHMSGRRALSSSIIARLASLVSFQTGEQAISDKRYLKEASDRRRVESRQKFAFKRQLTNRSNLTPSTLSRAVASKKETLSFQIAHHRVRPVRALLLRAVCFANDRISVSAFYSGALAPEYYWSCLSELANRRGTSRLPVNT